MLPVPSQNVQVFVRVRCTCVAVRTSDLESEGAMQGHLNSDCTGSKSRYRH